MAVHSAVGLGHVHTPFAWVFKTHVERDKAVVMKEDLGKLAFEQESKSLWQLLSHQPVNWGRVGGVESNAFSEAVVDSADQVTSNLYNQDVSKLSVSFISSDRPLIFFSIEITPPLDQHRYRAAVQLNDEEIRTIEGRRGRKDGSVLFSGFFSFVLEKDAFYELSIVFQNAQGNARAVSVQNARLVVIGARNA